MKAAIEETSRRRALQQAYNDANGITPETIRKAIHSPLAEILDAERVIVKKERTPPPEKDIDPRPA